MFTTTTAAAGSSSNDKLYESFQNVDTFFSAVYVSDMHLYTGHTWYERMHEIVFVVSNDLAIHFHLTLPQFYVLSYG